MQALIRKDTIEYMSKIAVGMLVRFVPKDNLCRLPLRPKDTDGIGIVTDIFKFDDDRKLNYTVRWNDDLGSTYGYHRDELKVLGKGR